MQLHGWPDGVPMQNPSTLTTAQNKVLLDLLHEGKIYFSRLEGVPAPATETNEAEASAAKDEEAIFEDSIDYTWISEEVTGDSNRPSSKVTRYVRVKVFTDHISG